MGLKKTHEDWLMECKAIHGDKYDYSLSQYTKWDGYVKIICPKHGVFEQRGRNHLVGHGCYACSREVSQAEYIERMTKKHDGKYDYSKTQTLKSTDRITVTCPIHGDFEQVAANHVRGNACPYCEKRRRFVLLMRGKPVLFYIVKLVTPYTTVYKIGATTSSLKKALSVIPRVYTVEVIEIREGLTGGEAWDMKHGMKRRNSGSQISPVIGFPGSRTDCFTVVEWTD